MRNSDYIEESADENTKHNKIESCMDLVDDVKKGKDHDYICRLISEHFSQKLFSLVSEIFLRKDKKEDQYEAEEDEDDDDIEGGEQDMIEEGDEDDYLEQYGQADNKYIKQRKLREKE